MTDALSRLIDRGAPTATVRLAADPDDAPRIQAAEKAVKAAERSVVTAKTPEDLQRAENQVELAEAKLAELLDDIVTIDIGLEGIGAPVVEEMMAAHPPSKKQIQQALKEAGGNPQARPRWDEDTFPIALLAATIATIAYSDAPDEVTNGVSEKDVAKLWKSKLTVSDRSQLFITALSLDQRGSSIGDLGKG